VGKWASGQVGKWASEGVKVIKVFFLNMRFFLRTLNFEEFLRIAGDRESLELYREVPFPNYGYEKIVTLFHRFCLVGGIPEVVESYTSDGRISNLSPLYEKHLETLFSNAASLASTGKTSERLEQIYQDTFPFAATRVSFRGFSNLDFKSREVSKAFRLLNDKGLLYLLYPTTQTTLPWKIDKGRAPRIQLPDTGLVNHFNGIQEALSGQDDLSAVFNRQISLHIVAQELFYTSGQADKRTSGQEVHFWVRDKTQSSAEVDFVIGYEDLMIPVEVKKGEPGRLRSLHQFVEKAQHPFAVRLHAGPLMVKEAKTLSGKRYYLMSLPYFLGGKIREHLEGFIKFVGKE